MKKIRKLEKMKNLISTCFIFILLVSSSSIYAQKDSITLQREARKLVREGNVMYNQNKYTDATCLLYTSPSPRDRTRSRMPSSA